MDVVTRSKQRDNGLLLLENDGWNSIGNVMNRLDYWGF